GEHSGRGGVMTARSRDRDAASAKQTLFGRFGRISLPLGFQMKEFGHARDPVRDGGGVIGRAGERRARSCRHHLSVVCPVRQWLRRWRSQLRLLDLPAMRCDGQRQWWILRGQCDVPGAATRNGPAARRGPQAPSLGDPDMRTLLPLCAVLLLVLAAGAARSSSDPASPCGAQGGGDAGGGRNCGFWTYQQCAAALSGNGGYCAENAMYQGPQPGMIPPPGALIRAHR